VFPQYGARQRLEADLADPGKRQERIVMAVPIPGVPNVFRRPKPALLVQTPDGAQRQGHSAAESVAETLAFE
jgi:hypothetical protein